MQTKNEQLSQDIYKILAIEPTNDFTVAKKAYLSKALATHPDKNPGISDEPFKMLQNAWEKINSKEKLALYFALHQKNRGHEFEQKLKESFSESSSTFATEKNRQSHAVPSDAVAQYRTDEVDIFIPVPFTPSDKPGLGNGYVNLSLDPKEQEINLENIRNHIMKCNNGAYQVGVTHEEAIKIANGHSHYLMMLIVRVRLPITRLSDFRVTEAELRGPEVLNARADGKYFTLQPDTIINKEDIHTVQPMAQSEYQNTIRFMHSLERAGSHINEIWSRNPNAFYVKGQKQSILEIGQFSSPTKKNEVEKSDSSRSITGLHIRDNIRAGFRMLFFTPSSSSPSSPTDNDLNSNNNNFLAKK